MNFKSFLLLCEASKVIIKKIPDGYNEGKWTWAVIEPGPYDDEIIESGFSTKRDALAWIASNQYVRSSAGRAQPSEG